MALPAPHPRHHNNVLLPSARFVMVDKVRQHAHRTSAMMRPSPRTSPPCADPARRKSSSAASDSSSNNDAPPPHSASHAAAASSSFSASSSSSSAQQPGRASAKRGKKPQKSAADASRKLQFINSSEPNFNRDPSVRMLVRSHVMKGVKRDEKLARQKLSSPPAKPHPSSGLPTPPAELEVVPHEPQHSELPSPTTGLLNGATMALYGAVSLAMRPESHSLLFYYRQVIGNAVYPFLDKLTFNPVQTDWIPCALADGVFFQTLLFSSASHQSFLGTGGQKSLLPPRILGSVFNQLGQRLDRNRNLSDATIGAVTCLAMVENMRGNYPNFKVHMDGLAKIISIRGVADLEEQMQLKVYRTDVEGAINFISRPILPPYARSHLPLADVVPPELSEALNTYLLSLQLESCGIEPELSETMCSITRFARSLNYVLSSKDVRMVPSSYDEDLICLQLQLLAVDVYDQVGIARATRLGGMLFIKTTMRGVARAPPSSRKLLQNLKDSLLVVRPEQRMAPLLLWLAVVGGVASHGLPEHAWFVERLRLISYNVPTLRAWPDCLRCLQGLPWVEWLHHTPFRAMWDEAHGSGVIELA